MSFFDPHIEMPNGRLYKQERYDRILEEQVAISYASKGISIADTDQLSPYDRQVILNAIKEIKEAEAEARAQAMGSSSYHSTSRY